MRNLIFIIFLLSPLKVLSQPLLNYSEGFYYRIAKSQSMSMSSLEIPTNYKLLNHASIERIQNSTPMLKFYADELERQGIPLDFVILPLIESGNNPQARSPANALGLWQFMPQTASEWGLKRSMNFDERVDVQKSTLAATKYLKSLHEHFHDWNLVLASYNWGPQSVERALKKGLRSPNGKINLNLLPLETQGYLINFYSYNRIIHDNWNKTPLSKYPNQDFIVKISLLDLDKHLLLGGLDSVGDSVLSQINGVSPKVMSKSSETVLVPTPIFTKFFIPNKISFKNQSKRVSISSCNSGSSEYVIKRGDTFQSISAKFKISVDKLIDLNPAIRFPRPGLNIMLC